MLSLHRLVLEFTSQLGVLTDCEPRGADKLVFVHVEHLDLDIPDLEEHFLPQVVNLVDFVFLDVLQDLFVGFLLRLHHFFPLISLLLDFRLLQDEFLELFDLHRLVVDFLRDFLDFRGVLFVDCLESLLVVDLFLLDFLSLGISLGFLIILFDFSVVSLLSLVESGLARNLLSVDDSDVSLRVPDLETLVVLLQSLVDLLDHRDKVLELDVLFVDVLLIFI